MLKKLCVFLIGLGFCLGTLGCSESKEAQMPKEKIPPPASKPGAATQSLEPPE